MVDGSKDAGEDRHHLTFATAGLFSELTSVGSSTTPDFENAATNKTG
jgi:hypothetical protein